MGKAAILAIFGAMAGLILKKTHPELAAVVVLAAGAVLLASAIAPLAQVVEAMSQMGAQAALPGSVLESALKITGVSLIAHFGAQTCRDAQQESLAQKVEFFGRVALLAMMAPVLLSLVTLVADLATP